MTLWIVKGGLDLTQTYSTFHDLELLRGKDFDGKIDGIAYLLSIHMSNRYEGVN